MKIASSLKSKKNRSSDIQMVRRKKSGKTRIYLICKSNPKFKVRQ